MINDRIGTIPFLRKNLFYISSLILAFVALLLSFIIKLRLNERIAIAVFSIFLIAIGMLNLESMFGEGMYIAFTIIEILIMLLLVYIHIKRKREMQKKKRY